MNIVNEFSLVSVFFSLVISRFFCNVDDVWMMWINFLGFFSEKKKKTFSRFLHITHDKQMMIIIWLPEMLFKKKSESLIYLEKFLNVISLFLSIGKKWMNDYDEWEKSLCK